MVVTLALIASPTVSVNNDAFTIKTKKKGGGNVTEQQYLHHNLQFKTPCVLLMEQLFLSCNNVNFQNQKNTGNNALAQQGDDNDKGGNSAKQSISQSQSSQQNSHVVSGKDTVGSGNNINVSNQENSGSNAAAAAQS